VIRLGIGFTIVGVFNFLYTVHVTFVLSQAVGGIHPVLEFATDTHPPDTETG